MDHSELLDRIKAMDTWEILGECWLDTLVSGDERELYGAELRSRGIVGLRALRYRAAAAGGYWWNIFVGEWGLLTFEKLLQGWCLNALLAVALVFGVVIHPALGVVLFLAGVRPTLWFGKLFARQRDQA